MKTLRGMVGFMLVALLLVAGAPNGQAADETVTEASGKAAEAEAVQPEVAALIRQLGADTFAEREKASAALVALGQPAVAALKQAAAGTDPEVVMRAKRVLAQLGAGPLEVHVVGCYSGDVGNGQPSQNHEPGEARIRIGDADHAMVLVLTAYEPVEWEVEVTGQAVIKRVILGGYYDQTVKGLPADVPVERHIQQNGDRTYFCIQDPNDPESVRGLQRLREITGAEITSLQGQYTLLRSQPIAVPAPAGGGMTGDWNQIPRQCRGRW